MCPIPSLANRKLPMAHLMFTLNGRVVIASRVKTVTIANASHAG